MTDGKLIDNLRRAHRFSRKFEVVARTLDWQLAVRTVRFMSKLQKAANWNNFFFVLISKPARAEADEILDYLEVVNKQLIERWISVQIH